MIFTEHLTHSLDFCLHQGQGSRKYFLSGSQIECVSQNAPISPQTDCFPFVRPYVCLYFCICVCLSVCLLFYLSICIFSLSVVLSRNNFCIYIVLPQTVCQKSICLEARLPRLPRFWTPAQRNLYWTKHTRSRKWKPLLKENPINIDYPDMEYSSILTINQGLCKKIPHTGDIKSLDWCGS